MLNVAPLPPAGMETFAGGAAREVSLLTRVTSTPPGGAGFSSVNVPVTAFPPTTPSALSERPQRIGHNPIEFCCQPRPYAATIVPIVAPPTGTVVIGETIASVLPSGTRTLAGVWACGKSEALLNCAPPGPASLFISPSAWG